MTAGTHLAAAALTASLCRGMGLEVGLLEGLALAAGALAPDVDTTTSGPGKFIRPLSSFLERRFGHRTLTHSLLFLGLLGGLLAPLWLPPEHSWRALALAFLAGYLSHLLLDTLNTNGVPLLWPSRLQFWFFASRQWRIRYGSPQEATLALGLALAGFAMWPLAGDGFSTLFRRFVATPETAVADYLKWREAHQVWVDLKGFNRVTQEALQGRYRVVEAVGKSGVLIEDEVGRTLEVSQAGQVVAYRVRAYRGPAVVVRDYRFDLGGRLVQDLLSAFPRQAQRVWVTGLLELASEAPPLVSPVGAYPRLRVEGQGRKTVRLHAATPQDLASLAGAYIQAGSAVVRAEYTPGQEGTLDLPTLEAPQVHPVVIPHLPSLGGLLVQPGDRVAQGEPLARYVDDLPLQKLAEQSSAKKAEAERLDAEVSRLEVRYRREKAALQAELQAARERLGRVRYLVAQGAEPRATEAEARGQVEVLEARRIRLDLDYSSQRARLLETQRERLLEAQQLARRQGREAERQLVRSPVSGRVAEVRVREVTARGVTVEVVVLGEPK